MRKPAGKIFDFFSKNEKADYAVIGLLAFIVVFLFFWSQGLWDPYESHAAEVSREALEDGKWFPLHFDGKPVAGLPPAFFMAQAAWMAGAGTSELAVRFFPALLAVLWLLFVTLSLRRLLGRKTAFFASLAILTTPFFFGNARHTSSHLVAAMLAFSVLLSVSNQLWSSQRKESGRRRPMLPWILLSLTFLSGGFSFLLFTALSLAAAVVAGFTGNFKPPDLRRLVSLPGIVIFALSSGLWIGAGLQAFGTAFFADLLDLQALSFGGMRAFGTSELFTYHIYHAGHMLYPWFMLLPAGMMWLAVLKPPEPMEDGRKFLIALFLGGPFLLLFLNTFLPVYLPLDMIAVCPSLAILGVWGLVHASQCEQIGENRMLLALGALLIVFGAASMGVDFFWELERPIEVIGYDFDRPYPKLTAIVKVAYNSVAIISGVSAGFLLFFRKRAMAIAWTLGVMALAVTLFITHHVFRTCGPYFSARQLIEAYEPVAKEGDTIATYLMEPQSRGSEIYYFKGRARHLQSRGDLENLMAERAGLGRLILISSHVRALYNDIYDASCGVKIRPLNEQRRWYSVSSFEGPPPTLPGDVVFKDAKDAGIAQPMEMPFAWEDVNYFTFMGYRAANLDPKTRIVKKGGWVDLELYWRAEKKIEQSWRVYLDATAVSKGKISGHVSQHHTPACGAYPTYRWKPGEIVRDFARLFFSSELDGGTYIIRTGIFSRTGQRMTTRPPADAGKKTPAKSVVNLVKINLQ